MVSSKAATVKEYLAELSDERRKEINAVRDVILSRLPSGYEEIISFGMISYVVPLSMYPQTHNKQPLMYAALASQKNYCSLYLMSVYANETLRKELESKVSMGKSCVKFNRASELPLALIGNIIGKTSMKQFIAMYEQSRSK